MLSFLLACTGTKGPADTGGTPPPPGVLVLIADDLGVDASACYPEFPGVQRAPQPTIEALCERGVVFERAWANPVCSPSRAGLLTGRYSHRHGVGESIGEDSPGLALDERLLPAALDAAGTGVTHAAFGKWHLAASDNGGEQHPNLAGFSHFSGALGGEVSNYGRWEHTVDGETGTATGYVTTRTVDDASRWIARQTGPWLATVAFHAPHTPIHAPALALHSQEDCVDETIDADPVPCFRAMVESMDREIGRLLEGLHPDTIVVYLGDNGSLDEVDQGAWPEGHAKSTLFLGGAWVPLVIVAPGLAEPGRREDLVDLVDLFPTLIELSGGALDAALDPERPIDGISLLPTLADAQQAHSRTFQLTEWYGARAPAVSSGQAITDGRLKRIRYRSGEELLFDIEADPAESTALDPEALSTEDRATWDWLGAELDARPVPDLGG